MGLEKLQGQLSAFISTWTETATASSATATATHAAESNKSHYITGFAGTGWNSMTAAGTITILIKDDTTTIMTFYSQNGPSADGNGITHSFSSPIQVTEGNPCSVEVTDDSSGDSVAANLWGFTS